MLRVRGMTAEETARIERLARSRTEGARTVERARMIRLASRGERVPEIAGELRVSEGAVRLWLKRFNQAGIDGLADLPRSGKPPTYTPEQVGEAVAASLTNPRSLGLPFASWTLDRLTAHLNEEKGVPIKRSRVGEILQAEGLRWRRQETWFGERHPEGTRPEYAEERGPSRPSIPPHPRGAS